MTPSEIFCNPLDPSRSIQLNNRYWPGEKFGLISIIADAEAMLQGGDLVSVARQLRHIKKFFPTERLFSKFLCRVHKLYSFRSQFGYVTGCLNLPADAVSANRYAGRDTRASYPLVSKLGFEELMEQTRQVYRDLYGSDLLKLNCTVRFAEPDARRADVTEHGALSDYHNDQYKGISTIIYLSEVNDSNGAFSFIRGSHLIPRSLVLTAIHQCVGFDMLLTEPHQLASFPLEFRGSVGISTFMDDDKTKILHGFREVLEGGIGTFVTFNGQYLLHRGGKPVSGTRTAAFFQPEGMIRHKMKSIRSLLYGVAYS